MKLESYEQVENTRAKLREIEEHYAKTQQRASDNDYVRRLTLRSLRRLMNQLTEEIVRFESHEKLTKESVK